MSEERAPTKDTLALHPRSAGAALAASMLDKATGLLSAHLHPLVLWAQGSDYSKKGPELLSAQRSQEDSSVAGRRLAGAGRRLHLRCLRSVQSENI